MAKIHYIRFLKHNFWVVIDKQNVHIFVNNYS